MRDYVTLLELRSEHRNLKSATRIVERLEAKAQALGLDVQHVHIRGYDHDEERERGEAT